MAINWTQVNVPTLLAVAATAAGVFNYVGDINTRLSDSETYRTMRSQQTDGKFTDLNNAVAGVRSDNAAIRMALQDVPYRVGNLEKGLEEQGKRTDRLSELILSNMDGFRKEIGGLGTKIEVLSSRIENNFPARKTNLLYSQPISDIP